MGRRFLDRTDALLLAWTLFTKLGVLLLGVLALWLATGTMPDLLAPWHRWDAPHYTDIAAFGYMANDPGNLSFPGYEQVYPGDVDLYIVFFPLFPWLTAILIPLVGDPIVAAFIVATVASLFVAPMLYRLVAVDLGHRVGIRAAAFLLVFPTAYFLHIGYTEALFLSLAFGSMWLARIGRWWDAGVIGGLAALTRMNGLVLIPVLAVEAWLQWREHRRIEVSWLGIGLVAVGFAIYLGVNWNVYGDPLAFSEIQREHWFKGLTPPWDGIAGVIDWISNPDPDLALMIGWVELAFIVLGLVATVATAIWLRPTWATWMAGNWLMIVSTGFVISVPRYSIALFGIMVWSALAAERWRVVGWLIGAGSLAGMGYFAWRFATGLWAF